MPEDLNASLQNSEAVSNTLDDSQHEKMSHAIIIGIERYAPDSPFDECPLPGAASDALRFSRQLRHWGVPARNIRLFLTRAEPSRYEQPNTAGGTFAQDVQKPEFGTLWKAFTDELYNKQGDTLYVFWSGHGYWTGDRDRKLIFSDTSLQNLVSLDLSTLLVYLRSSYLSFNRCVVIVDACGQWFAGAQSVPTLPRMEFPQPAPRTGSTGIRPIFVVFSVERGNFADFLPDVLETEQTSDSITGPSSLFYRYFSKLAAQHSRVPDFTHLTKQLQETIVKDHGLGVRPLFYADDWNGETLVSPSLLVGQLITTDAFLHSPREIFRLRSRAWAYTRDPRQLPGLSELVWVARHRRTLSLTDLERDTVRLGIKRLIRRSLLGTCLLMALLVVLVLPAYLSSYASQARNLVSSVIDTPSPNGLDSLYLPEETSYLPFDLSGLRKNAIRAEIDSRVQRLSAEIAGKSGSSETAITTASLKQKTDLARLRLLQWRLYRDPTVINALRFDSERTVRSRIIVDSPEYISLDHVTYMLRKQILSSDGSPLPDRGSELSALLLIYGMLSGTSPVSESVYHELPLVAKKPFPDWLKQLQHTSDPAVCSAARWLFAKIGGKRSLSHSVYAQIASLDNAHISNPISDSRVFPNGVSMRIKYFDPPELGGSAHQDSPEVLAVRCVVFRFPANFKTTIGSDRARKNATLRANRQSAALEHSFGLATREVTRSDFECFVQETRGRSLMRNFDYSSPSDAGGMACPMDHVTWHGAAAFCNWMTKKYFKFEDCCFQEISDAEEVVLWGAKSTPTKGQPFAVKQNYRSLKGFRLPDEVEWEFACKAGCQDDFFFGQDADLLAQFGQVDQKTLARCENFMPNDFGMFDLFGNVCEWTINDAGSYPVAGQVEAHGIPAAGVKRGGKYSDSIGTEWKTDPPLISSHCRSVGFRVDAIEGDGFRVAFTVGR